MRRNNQSITISLLLLPIAVLLCGAAVANACDVVIVKSGDIKPFNETVQGFKSAANCETREVVPPRSGEHETAQKVRRMRPDLILAVGQSALAAVGEIEDIPIVYAMLLNPPPSLAKKKNISGVSMNIAPEVYVDALIKTLFTRKRIGLIYDPEKSSSFVERALNAARFKGFDLIAKKAETPREVLPALASMAAGIDVFWLIPDTTVVTPDTVPLLLRSALENNIPVITFTSRYVDMGALMSLDIDAYDMGVQAGETAKKLLTAKMPAPPIRVDARKVFTVINMKMTKKFGDRLLREAKAVAR